MILDILNQPQGWARFNEKIPQTKHPLLPTVTEANVRALLGSGKSDEDVLGLISERERAIKLAASDPLHNGWEPQMWSDADRLLAQGNELLILGGNRSSKTTYMVKRVVEHLRDNPGSIIWCLSTTFETSVRDQQRAVNAYLPPDWRGIKRNKLTNLTFSHKRGFTDKALVAPNGAECRFLNYAQDSDVLQGGQVDLWWADELVPIEWVVNLRSRTVDRRGRGVVTFTPIRGYTQTVAEYLNGAKVTKWAPCPLIPDKKLWPGGKKGMVPVEMECLHSKRRVIFFHPDKNPYIDFESLVDAWKDKGQNSILCRVYGLTTGVSNCKFPRFGRHNIVAHDKIPKDGTNYMVVDFSYAKPWCIMWARVRQVGGKKFVYVYREWPDMDGYGDWVLRSDKPDGSPGPAQAPLGLGINDYKRLIVEQEAGETIYIRYGDPRSGASTTLADEGASSIMQTMADDESGTPSMIVEPVSGTDGVMHVMEGVNLINMLLEYDLDQPISPSNQPSLYISEKCQQLITCLQMWTGADGDKGASKDFVDLLRYLAIMDPEQARANMVLHKGGSY